MSDDPTGLTLDELAAQEAELRFDRFDYDDAWRLGSMLVETARARALPIAIDITRGGQQLFHAALAGSTPDNDAWIQRKIRSVLRFGRSSMYLSLQRSLDGRSLAEVSFVDPHEFAAAGGCFPIHVKGCGIVGTVTVSGLPQVDDHRLVVETIRAFLTPSA
ncbi:MAG TPA: heme-degrading domain-containing protein [Acidothermaceae bacterium]